ncbi:MAG: helix-turn-helix transcriptional regulator [Acidithiobacillus sp.]|uniref:helix-turn-helix transcriptional regulator n=1 Tax=Acidithiobacillus sp. TaxID=1872118 RepID=UPI003D077A1B
MSKEPTVGPIFTKEKIAERYGVTSRTIESWVAHGELPAPVHIGRRCYWHEAALTRWESHRFCIDVQPSATRPKRGQL